MGAAFFDCAKPGMGQTAKIANNLALGIQMQSIVEAMAFGEKMGIDLKILKEVMSKATSRWADQLLESQRCQPRPWAHSGSPLVERLQRGVHE